MNPYYRSWQFFLSWGLAILLTLGIIQGFHIKPLWLCFLIGVICGAITMIPAVRSYNRTQQKGEKTDDEYDWQGPPQGW